MPGTRRGDIITVRIRHNQAECYHVYWSRPSVCLYLATFPHYCTLTDVTLGNGRGCSLVVNNWAYVQISADVVVWHHAYAYMLLTGAAMQTRIDQRYTTVGVSPRLPHWAVSNAFPAHSTLQPPVTSSVGIKLQFYRRMDGGNS